MKVLLDQGLPRSTVAHLVGAGIQAEHVGNLNLGAASDADILQAAKDHGAVIVTLDADFHLLLAKSGATAPSVIRIRREGLKGESLAALLIQVLTIASVEIAAGAVVSVTATRVRIRRLPIGR